MAGEKHKTEPRPSVTLLAGLSDLEQAAIARDYERRTGQAMRCMPCVETGRAHSIRPEAEAGEPSREVVAILERPHGPVPVCEECYRTMVDASERG